MLASEEREKCRQIEERENKKDFYGKDIFVIS